jgi:ribosome-binding protein aMBF1 (putative translation factor)
VGKLISRLPQIVQDYLDKHEMSQVVLAKKADIDPASLSRLLRTDTKRVDLETASKLQKIIGFKASELIVEIEE